MARTKRISQASASGKANTSSTAASSLPTPTGSPEYVPDDYEIEGGDTSASVNDAGSSPPTPTPTQQATSSKRKARGSANSTPSPVKKRTKPAPSQPIDLDSDEEGTLSDGAQGDDDDLETPKASQLNARPKRIAGDVKPQAESKGKGKQKAGNLKTELGGKVGTSSVAGDVFAASVGNDPGPAEKDDILSLPSSAFTVANKDEWVGTYVEMTKVHMFVKARSSDDPLLANKAILDPYMSKHGYYENLPNANRLQLFSHGTPGTSFTNGDLTSMVPGLSISTWDCFGIERSYIASILRFPRQGQYVNPSTMDVTELVFKESWSSQGPGSAFVVCDRKNGIPVIFASVCGIMESFIAFGKNIGVDNRPPFAKGMDVLKHRFEYERLSCGIATLWHGEDINAPIQQRHITMQTMNRRNTDVDTRQTHRSEKKVGKMDIKSYASPSKKYTPKNKTALDFSDEVPVYDGREEAFKPQDFARCIGRLPAYPTDHGEVPEGTGALVGYTISTSKYMDNWKLTFNLLWVVVLAD